MRSSDRTYPGIWKDPVTLADWEAKKDAIPEKLGYLNGRLMADDDPEEWTGPKGKYK